MLSITIYQHHDGRVSNSDKFIQWWFVRIFFSRSFARDCSARERDISSRSEMTRIRYNFARIRDENVNFILFARIVLIPSLILCFSVTPAAILTFSTFRSCARIWDRILYICGELGMNIRQKLEVHGISDEYGK